MVEEYGSNIIEMAVQREEAASRLVRPDLDLVIVTARNKKGLGFVEVNASDGAIVFFESVNQCSHSVVPKLDGRRV